jgi:hypothetical protein
MHTVQQPCVGQIGQVAPDGLQRDGKAFSQRFHDNAPLVARNFQYFGLPKTQGHLDTPPHRRTPLGAPMPLNIAVDSQIQQHDESPKHAHRMRAYMFVS